MSYYIEVKSIPQVKLSLGNWLQCNNTNYTNNHIASVIMCTQLAMQLILNSMITTH